MVKPRRRDQAKERYWRGVLRQWRRSGLTGRGFCVERGLSEPSFYGWRRELARRDGERRSLAAPVAPTPTKRAHRPRAALLSVEPRSATFVQLAMAKDAGASAIDIVVGGRVLRVRAGFDVDLLRQLLRVLEEPAC